MTFASLLVALAVAVALFYGNFALAYLVDLVTGRGVPVGRFLGTSVVAFLGVSPAIGLLRLLAALPK